MNEGPGNSSHNQWNSAANSRRPYVFVSYKSHDLPAVRSLVDALESRGIPCWVAERDIPPGHPFPQEIVRAITESKAFLLTVTRSAVADPTQVIRELTIADNARIPMVPVMLDNLPLSELGGLTFYLSVPQVFRLYGREQVKALDDLASALANTIHEGLRVQPSPPKQLRPLKLDQRWTIGSGVAASLAVIGLVLWIILSNSSKTSPSALATNPPQQPAAASAPLNTSLIAQKKADARKAADDKDYAKELALYKEAAELGDSDSMSQVGAMYYEGAGVAEDEKQAEQWFIRSKAAGSSLGARNLDHLHERWAEKDRKTSPDGTASTSGNQTSQDLATLKKQADTGDVQALYKVASVYFQGTGVKQSFSTGFRWLKRSAEGGYGQAMNDLGICYLDGLGVKPDKEMARKWLKEAAHHGVEMAESNLKLIDKKR